MRNKIEPPRTLLSADCWLLTYMADCKAVKRGIPTVTYLVEIAHAWTGGLSPRRPDPADDKWSFVSLHGRPVLGGWWRLLCAEVTAWGLWWPLCSSEPPISA